MKKELHSQSLYTLQLPKLAHTIIKSCSYCLLLLLLQQPLFAQGDTLVSFWQGYHTPNIIESNITVTDLMEGPGITADDCSGDYVVASGFDQGFAIDGLNNGDYWEFSITPDPGFMLQFNWYEVQRRASLHTSGQMNTLGTVYWKIGSGSWVQSNITAGVQQMTNPSFCTSSSSRRPHYPSFTSTQTVTFRIVRYIYDNDNLGYNRVTRNGYQWLSGFVTEALPVDLIRFEATSNDQNKVLLEWATASEENNLGFEIEHSIDGRNWKNIDFVEGRGTTAETQGYTYLDESPRHGNNYYRLKQVDFDGQFEHSPIRQVMVTSEEAQLNVYPNPTDGQVTLSIHNPNKERALMKLFDSTGKVIWEEQFNERESTILWEKNFDLPQREIYFVMTQIGDKIETRKITVVDKM